MILVTGGNGQLANQLRRQLTGNVVFLDEKMLDITKPQSLLNAIDQFDPTYIINTAGYTDVSLAEKEPEKAALINATAVQDLGGICFDRNVRLIHISTDYVFSGSVPVPRKEHDETGALNVYGHSKLMGERLLREINPDAIIIRTSWLYSTFGRNFAMTLYRKSANSRVSLPVDQVGTPTYAGHLAKVIERVIQLNLDGVGGIYHYSDEGVASWYDFGNEIKHTANLQIDLEPKISLLSDLPRPRYSVLDKSKIKEVFKIEIPHWTEGVIRWAIDLG